MIKEIKIPEIGEEVKEATIVDVLVAVGDMVTEEQGIVEVETDKAMVEIPSPAAGKIVEITVASGDNVKIGQTIAKLDTEATSEKSAEPEPSPEPEKKLEPASEPEEKPEPKAAEKPDRAEPKAQPQKAAPAPKPTASATARADVAASPSVRRLARELGVDITQVPGSGPGGRLTAEDVKAYVKGGPPPSPTAEPSSPIPELSGDLPDFAQWGEIEAVEMNKVRRLTAQSTGFSWRTIPHVTQYDEADITHVQESIDRYRKNAAKDGVRLTITSILLKVVTAALRKFPRFNASVDETGGLMILKKYYHIGIATATDRGLLVPVIRDTDKKDILSLAADLADLAERTRNKRVGPDEMEGGTFTISNQGGIGGTQFSPIVYWPQVAILGVSRSKPQPVYVDDKHLERRIILPLSLSYDHRAVDGADAAAFLRWIVEALEHPLLMDLGE